MKEEWREGGKNGGRWKNMPDQICRTNAGPNHPASPIRKSITIHEANDAIEQHLDP